MNQLQGGFGRAVWHWGPRALVLGAAVLSLVALARGGAPAAPGIVEPPVSPDNQEKREQAAPLSAEDLFKQVSPAVVRVIVRDEKFAETGLGSGFFLAQDGLLITNCHVIEGARFATVLLPTGATFFVDGVLALDKDSDLAILKVNGQGFAHLALAPPGSTPQVGARVYAIGNPQGLTNTLSEGIVSNVHRAPEGPFVLQTTAAISLGSSGGPLLDSAGRVIGVTTAYFTEGQNLNFAISSDSVHALLSKAGVGISQPLASAGAPPLDAAATGKFQAAWDAIAQQRWSEAVQRLQRLRESDPDNPAVWFCLGFLHGELRNQDLAIEAYKEAIRLKPDFAEAYFRLGVSHDSLGQNAEATQALNEAVRLKPDYAEAYAYLGYYYRQRSQYAEATQSFKKAILLRPDFADAYFGLGICYKRLGQRTEALRAYWTLRRLDTAMAIQLREIIGEP